MNITEIQTPEEREMQGKTFRQEVRRGNGFVSGVQFSLVAGDTPEFEVEKIQDEEIECDDWQDYCVDGDENCMTAMQLAFQDALDKEWLTNSNML